MKSALKTILCIILVVPSVVSLDTIEMTVPSPIGKEPSIDAAKEHYAFCPDRVEQFTKYQIVNGPAGSRSVFDFWYFEWNQTAAT